MPVYLLHFDRKLAHAGHYIGYAKDVEKRLEHHRGGRGSRLLNRLNELSIAYVVAREWKDADRTFERKLKNRKKAAMLCPICTAGALERGNA